MKELTVGGMEISCPHHSCLAEVSLHLVALSIEFPHTGVLDLHLEHHVAMLPVCGWGRGRRERGEGVAV